MQVIVFVLALLLSKWMWFDEWYDIEGFLNWLAFIFSTLAIFILLAHVIIPSLIYTFIPKNKQ
jgi:hypothetical protein